MALRMGLNKEQKNRLGTRPLWLGVVVLHFCVLALVVVALYQSRAEAFRAAQNISNNLSHSVEQSLESLFARLDIGLICIADEIQRRYASGDNDSDEIQQEIDVQNAHNSDGQGFQVFGADGRPLYADRGAKDNISQRDYFVRLKNDPHQELVVSPPDPRQSLDQMSITLARRFNLPDGAFAGVVQVAIPVRHLSDMFSWFNPGEHGAALVFDLDHAMLMRYPLPPTGIIGSKTFMSDQARSIIDSGVTDAEYQMLSPLDHLKKMVHLQKIGKFPLYSFVAYAEVDYLLQWRHDAIDLSLFALIFLILLTAAARQIAVRVTEGEKAEADLHRSNERYERLVSNIPWGVFIMRIKSNGLLVFEYVSTRLSQLLGVPVDELLKDAASAISLIHPDDLDDFLALHGELSETMGAFRWKGRFVIDGKVRIFIVESTPTPLPDGESLWNGVMADVTEQELSEQRLRESDEKLRGLYELSPLGIALTSAEGRFVDFNESFQEITGYSERELKSLDFWKLTPEKYKDDEARQLEALDRTGSYGPYRKEYMAKDGTLVPVQLNGVRIIGADGASYTWSIVENITERLRAEEELRLSLERFRLMTSSVKDYAIYLLDAEGRVLTWNDGARRLKQYDASEIIGRSIECFYTPEDLAAGKVRSLLATAQAAGLSEDEGWHVRRDGSRFWADVSISCLRGDSGAVVGYVKITRDISERKLVQDTMRLTAVLFEKSLEGIMITDKDRNIIQVNEAFLSVTGYSRQDVIGKNPRILKSNHHDAAFYDAMWESINQTGHWIGEIWNKRKTGEIYPDLLSITAVTNDQGGVTNYLGITTDLSRIKSHERQLEHAAHYDPLTGTANRVLLADRMEQALAYAKRDENMMAICYLDLDGFKPINDSYGHLTGDRLLVEISKRIQSSVRATDTVSRLGGDEFVVLLVGLHRVEECTSVLDGLLKAIGNPVHIDEHKFVVTASIGVSISQSGEGDADTLLRHADKAMYVAKDAGRNRYHFYDAAQDILTREHFQSLKRINQALLDNEFELYYQPKVDMHTNQLVGAEALIRWNHPERGLVPPLEFLPVIENTDMEIAVGEWVIDAALNQLDLWTAIGLSIEISINISASHLQSEDFIGTLRRKLAEHPTLPPGLLEIEILETAALQDMSKAKEIISECNKMGVGFALDDFGTGYSSLTYLRSIPAGTLKIDQTFVRDMLEDQGDRAIVDGIIVLARAFDLKVVAEGVETSEHYRALVKMGCQIGQGYGIARPMSAAKFHEWYQSLSDTAQPIFAR